MFVSALDRPVEPVSFSLSVDRGHAHEGGARSRWMATRIGTHHRASDSHFSQLEGDGTGMAHNAGACLDQLELQAGQRPVGHFFGQFDAPQEGGQVVGQCVQLQPDLIVAELPA
jgi:hypothetical protein